MKKDKIKVILVIPNLMPGGAERIMAFLSKNLSTKHFDTKLLVLGPQSSTAYDINGVNVSFLNKTRVLTSLPNLYIYIKKSKPDIVMSSIDHLNVTMGTLSVLFPKTIFIGRQASISQVSSNFHSKKTNKLFTVLRKWALNNFDYLVCQSYDMYLDSKRHYGIKEEKLTIIHNPITENFGVKKNRVIKPKETIKFITVGRLDKIKGHLRLLNILSKIKYPYNYTIIGDGPQKKLILDTIKSLKLLKKVKFVDFTDRVQDYLMDSDYFLQGSYTEGFPNALLESCVVGTPVIAFEAPGGTREIIESGRNGFIASNEDEFLHYLLNLKPFDANTVSKTVYKKFDKNIVLNQYETFFMKALKKSTL
ncbi:glycosyltransferase [Zobellia galactanivorans]|uniref:glycosyltransferase n=1 Tax=Zobellia galactanivorans (strain DSM 12802 / CCUG 47099 / CIP 106680 / NCIMB 13871 / Dsij) TaxID=63186 RepID=UPI001C071811|nr:glycosyltransferase [Zobellia galactanivorans]MBU3024411.1 glycosyltransferase [Zobellia galactanivorans]